ncbi:hypothetical protein [Aureibacillus halotolerans]|uniref:Uncharacterized protein n=1 Tax=Aureibacillus halotolerans TaxID=1508390 RepID=A0A4R6U6T2_9BACI|nr:hypothetical protein [Aureibacillus halotolerans]TDQ42220.1 hypothetical protein EV213_102251 [Aureibacillus halotolerans]
MTKYLYTFFLLLILGACSQELASKPQDANFQSLLEQAEEAITGMEFEKAKSLYDQMLTYSEDELSYYDGRMNLIKTRQEQASLLLNQFSNEERTNLSPEQLASLLELNQTITSLKGTVDQWQTSAFEPDITEVSAYYKELNQFEEDVQFMPSLPLEDDVAAIRKEADQYVRNTLIQPLTNQISAAISKEDTAGAHSALKSLQDIEKQLPRVTGEIYEAQWIAFVQYKASYLLQPGQMFQREQIIFENMEQGTITFLGDGVHEDTRKLFFRIEGPIARWMDKLPITARATLTNGKTIQSGNWSVYQLEQDNALATAAFPSPENTLEQVSFSWANNEQPLREVVVNPVTPKTMAPAVKRLSQDTTPLNGRLINSEYELSFSSFKASDEVLTISGTVQANQDLQTSKTVYAKLPGTELTAKGQLNIDLAAGESGPFSVQFTFDQTLSEHTNLFKWTVDQMSTTLSLQEQRSISLVEELLVDQPWLSRTAYQKEIAINAATGQFFSDVNGEQWFNAIAVSSGPSGDNPTFDIFASPNQRSFSGSIAVSEATSGKGYGTSLITFSVGGEVVRQISLDDIVQYGPFELSLANSSVINITLEQMPGAQGYQQILFTNSKVSETTVEQEE